MSKFRNRPWLGAIWLMNLLVLPLMALVGRPLAEWLEAVIGASGIGWMLGGLIGILVIGASGWLYRVYGLRGLVHPVWIGLILIPMMMYVSQSPERWLHIPLFGLLGFVSVYFWSVRTGAEISFAYAFGDELIQYYLPERHGSFEDVLINMVCVGIGIGLYLILDYERG